MGTSKQGSGSASFSPLIPTWLDDPNAGPPPENNPNVPNHQGDEQRPTIPPPQTGNRFKAARKLFSGFAASGGQNTRPLKQAVRDYIRHGTNGSAGAVRRMAVARIASTKALSIFLGFQQQGVTQTLDFFNLQRLVGRPTREIFLGITDVVCPSGGAIDEAIARDAWLETVAEIDAFGIQNIENLTAEQIELFFISFIAHTIEAKLYQEIGVNGFKYASDLEDIDNLDAQFRAYIKGAVQDAFGGDINVLSGMPDGEMQRIVDQIYRETFELLLTMGDSE